jgi:hypothetical protein
MKAVSLLVAAILGLTVGRYGGGALFNAINPPESTSSYPTPVSTPPVEMDPEPRPDSRRPEKEESLEEKLKRKAMKEFRKRMKQAEREIKRRTGIGEEYR